MLLKFLKVITVFSFLCLSYEAEHIGGRFWELLVYGVFSGGFYMIVSCVYLLVLALIILTAFFTVKGKEFYLLLVCGVVLLIPVTLHLEYLIYSGRKNFDFLIWLTVFMISYILALYKQWKAGQLSHLHG